MSLIKQVGKVAIMIYKRNERMELKEKKIFTITLCLHEYHVNVLFLVDCVVFKWLIIYKHILNNCGHLNVI